jgi:LPS-assembly protein
VIKINRYGMSMFFNRLIGFLLMLTLLGQAAASLPELSAIEPLEFDEASQRLIARGDAELVAGPARLRADRITFYREYALADAEGSVVAQRDGLRVLAARISFDINDQVMSAQNFRSGLFPVYIEGEQAGGDRNRVDIQNGRIWYGEPGRLTPSARIGSGTYLAGESVTVRQAQLRVGPFPLLYLPRYSHALEEPPLSLSLNGGYRSDLGLFIESETVAPINQYLRAGANLNIYSRRGVLVGPVAQYRHARGDSVLGGSLSTGWISDGSDSRRGNDFLGRSISQERGFVEWRHLQQYGERFQIAGVASYWSDAEVTRDFRRRQFRDNQSPDTFLESSYAFDNVVVSAFGRFRPNSFQQVVERQPEVRVDLLPMALGETGVYQRGSLSYVRLQERSVNELLGQSVLDSEVDRLDATYRLQRPFRLTDWMTLTPLAGGRITHYANQQQDPVFNPNFDNRDYTRSLYELGFDLEARAYANYPTRNRLWGVDGLRHIVRPVARYRYFSDPGSSSQNRIAAIDRQIFNLNRPLLDFSDLRSIDTLQETHLVRLGIENQILTRQAVYGSRQLAAFNVYQDVHFKRNQRYTGARERTLEASWVELMLQPAHWLRFNVMSRFQTERMKLEELRTRIALVSGEIWELGFSSDHLDTKLDQYRVDFLYRLSERYSLLVDTRYDARDSRFIATRFGVYTRIGTAWEVLYALTFRENAQREDDVEFSVQMSLVGQP